MINPANFINQASEFGFRLYTGVPCSYLKPLINYVIDAPELDYIAAANEGDAVAIASGAEVAGRHAVVMLQNSGLGNAVNPLTSLNAIFKLPVLLIITWRGEPAGKADEPQHLLMGQITLPMLDLMGISWAFFPENDQEIVDKLERAVAEMSRTGMPYALIMRKESVTPYQLTTSLKPRIDQPETIAPPQWPTQLPDRDQLLATIQQHCQPTDAIVATTGYTGRALYAQSDRDNQFYMVGSMGCASSFAQGLAIAAPQRRVIVIDGDGAALMRLGAFATIGYYAPKNLIHLLLDNESYESTGGQSTLSHSADLAAIARSCGYPKVIRATTNAELAAALATSANGPTFIHIKVSAAKSNNLPRPTITPAQVAMRFRDWLKD